MECEGQRGAAALIVQLVDLANCLQARLAEPCEAQGVHASRFAVLRAVANVNRDGCSQTELANQLGLSESNVCSLVERLRASGLLFRFRSKTDRRRSVLMLTERGRQLTEAISLAQAAKAVAVISVLDSGQQVQLHQLVQRLREHLDSSDMRPIEGVTSYPHSTMDQSSQQGTRRAS